MSDSMTDEQFAKWLQDEEFRQQRENATAQNSERLAAERADAEYARRLASEEEHRQQLQRQPQPQQSRGAPGAPMAGLENAIALQHGQTIAIRLQHPGTRNQIDEALYAHHVDRNVMMFEMVRKRGTYLRVKDTSETEFSKVVDECSQFVVENTDGGMLYLGARKHVQKVNLSGGVGWMLALSHNGSLIGNSSRCAMAQWRLLAAPDAPSYAPLPGPARSVGATSGGVTGPVPPESSLSRDTSIHMNPLMAGLTQTSTQSADHNDQRRSTVIQRQVDWLDSAVGQTWLSQDRDGRRQLKLLHERGKLRRLLYRPDWPKAALQWKDYATLHSDYITQECSSEDILCINFQEFYDKGYTVCQGALKHGSVISAALKMINYWLGQYPNHPTINPQGNIDLSGEILTDQSLLALLYETQLLHSLKGFFKEGFAIKPCLECEVSLKYPDYCASDDSVGFGGKRWRIDSPASNECYSILVGVPLTATVSVSEEEGNLCVFPAKQSEVFESRDISSLNDVMDMSKPDFGVPDKLHLNVGDVVLMSQFAPRRESPNYSANTNYMVRN
jgi:hypothetical protein